MKKQTQTNSSKFKISIQKKSQVDLYETLCSTSESKEACRRYVDRLEEASTNIGSGLTSAK